MGAPCSDRQSRNTLKFFRARRGDYQRHGLQAFDLPLQGVDVTAGLAYQGACSLEPSLSTAIIEGKGGWEGGERVREGDRGRGGGQIHTYASASRRTAHMSPG